MLNNLTRTAIFLGLSAIGIFTTAHAQTKTITVTAADDTFVRAGIHADKNYGNESPLRVMHTPWYLNNQREALMRFSLSGRGVQWPVVSAKLRFKRHFAGEKVKAGLVTSSIRLVDQDWGESGELDVTYNRKPSYDALPFATFKPTTKWAEWMEIDVTDVLNSGNLEKMAFAIENITKGQYTQWGIFSRESMYAPELVVVSPEKPACVVYNNYRAGENPWGPDQPWKNWEKLTLNSAQCITVPAGLSLKDVFIKTSSENNTNLNCDMRATVSDTNGNRRVIDQGWERYNGVFNGSELHLNVTNGCNELILKVEPQ